MPRVLKAADVYVDPDNTVRIKSEIPRHMLRLALKPEISEENEESPEDIIRSAQKKAKREAEIIISHAEIEANNIVREAEKRAGLIVMEAETRMTEESRRLYEETKNEAFQKGMDEAAAAGNNIRAEAQSVLDSALREQNEMRLALEPDAVNLITAIIEKLIGNAVDINPAVIVSLIRNGFAESGTSIKGTVTIRVSENDFAVVNNNIDEIDAAAGGMAEIEIVRDYSLGPNDCVIDTQYGGIDVSLTPQLKSLIENIYYLMRQAK